MPPLAQNQKEIDQCLKIIDPHLDQLIVAEKLAPIFKQQVIDYIIPLALHLNSKSNNNTFSVALNGAQGSGKSTLCLFLKLILNHYCKKNTVVLSIDDFYLSHSKRLELSDKIHPLLKTRGVPGTHDIDLACFIIKTLKESLANDHIALPSFDKAKDDCVPQSHWKTVAGPVDIILFEGWCVGANPELQNELLLPVNQLEKEEDMNEDWRQYVNQQLAETYPMLFSLFNYLIMLKVPSMEQVYEWRTLQEKKLIQTLDEGDLADSKTMNDSELKRFIMHYERLTRHILEEMPHRANIVINIDQEHNVKNISLKDI